MAAPGPPAPKRSIAAPGPPTPKLAVETKTPTLPPAPAPAIGSGGPKAAAAKPKDEHKTRTPITPNAKASAAAESAGVGSGEDVGSDSDSGSGSPVIVLPPGTTIVGSRTWGFLDAQFVLRRIDRVDQFVVLTIDVSDDASGAGAQSIPFRVNSSDVSSSASDSISLEMDGDGDVFLEIGGTRGASLEHIDALQLLPPIGPAYWWINDCCNYMS